MKLKSIDLCLTFENCGVFKDLLLVGDADMPNVTFVAQDEADEDGEIAITLTSPEFDNFCTAIGETLNMLSSMRESQEPADPNNRVVGHCARRTIDKLPLSPEHCETCPGCGGLTGEAAYAMRSRKKIQAIKADREVSGRGLKESKDFVEQWAKRFEVFGEFM